MLFAHADASNTSSRRLICDYSAILSWVGMDCGGGGHGSSRFLGSMFRGYMPWTLMHGHYLVNPTNLSLDRTPLQSQRLRGSNQTYRLNNHRQDHLAERCETAVCGPYEVATRTVFICLLAFHRPVAPYAVCWPYHPKFIGPGDRRHSTLKHAYCPIHIPKPASTSI